VLIESVGPVRELGGKVLSKRVESNVLILYSVLLPYRKRKTSWRRRQVEKKKMSCGRRALLDAAALARVLRLSRLVNTAALLGLPRRVLSVCLVRERIGTEPLRTPFPRVWLQL
jgi:hypothetical protein